MLTAHHLRLKKGHQGETAMKHKHVSDVSCISHMLSSKFVFTCVDGHQVPRFSDIFKQWQWQLEDPVMLKMSWDLAPEWLHSLNLKLTSCTAPENRKTTLTFLDSVLLDSKLSSRRRYALRWEIWRKWMKMDHWFNDLILVRNSSRGSHSYWIDGWHKAERSAQRKRHIELCDLIATFGKTSSHEPFTSWFESSC